MTLIRKIFISLTFLCEFVVACPDSEIQCVPESVRGEEACIVVKDHIKHTKSWLDEEYRIELYEETADVLIFSVIHMDDEKSIAPGGGKSVEIYIDPEQMKIVNELHYQ